MRITPVNYTNQMNKNQLTFGMTPAGTQELIIRQPIIKLPHRFPGDVTVYVRDALHLGGFQHLFSRGGNEGRITSSHLSSTPPTHSRRNLFPIKFRSGV